MLFGEAFGRVESFTVGNYMHDVSVDDLLIYEVRPGAHQVDMISLFLNPLCRKQ